MKKCQNCKAKAKIWKTTVDSVLSGRIEMYDVQCPVCGIGTAYSYNTVEEAIAAWDKWKQVGVVKIDRKYASEVK